MNMRLGRIRMGVILTWALAAPGALAAASGLPQATDLRADARFADSRKIPILVVFTSPTCHYCERAKTEYLVPLHQDPAFAGRVLIREVSLDASVPLTDFAGAKTTGADFAAAAGVSIVPTVKVYAAGAPVGEPLVGLLGADYYYGYLVDAIDAGLAALRPVAK